MRRSVGIDAEVAQVALLQKIDHSNQVTGIWILTVYAVAINRYICAGVVL